MQRLVRTVQNCAAGRGDLPGSVLGWLSTGAWVAQYLVRQWIHILPQFEDGFMVDFPTFST